MDIYLDHNATTPIDPEVLEEMRPFLESRFGNPSSIHRFGQAAKRGVDTARERVASLIGADPEEIVFTSGGTEANNQAIFGVARRSPRNRFITSQVEHQAVLAPFETLSDLGKETVQAPVDEDGQILPDALSDAVTEECALVSIMTANNDVGTVQPVKQIAEIARSKGALFHTDAVQAVGKIPVDMNETAADLLSISSHKLYGPKGAGALYIRRGVSLSPFLFGGHQESRKRAGTENVPAVVGFGKACALAAERRDSDAARIAGLRDRLQNGIRARIPDARVFGGKERLPGTLNMGFGGIEGDTMMMVLDLQGIAVSTGSACMTESRTLSHVLTAMGVGPLLAKGSVRFSIGRRNTEAEIDATIQAVADTVERLRRT